MTVEEHLKKLDDILADTTGLYILLAMAQELRVDFAEKALLDKIFNKAEDI